jgi:hypothetical protein
MRENLDSQTELFKVLVKEIHAGFKKLIDEIPSTQNQQITLMTDNMEKVLSANTTVLAESMTQNLKGQCIVCLQAWLEVNQTDDQSSLPSLAQSFGKSGTIDFQM